MGNPTTSDSHRDAPADPPARKSFDRGALAWAVGGGVAVVLSAVTWYWTPQRADPFAGLPPINACDLMRLEDADPDDTLTLAPVRAPIEQSVGHVVAKCSYGTRDLPIRVIGLEVRRFATAAAAEGVQASSEAVVRRLALADAVPVSGLGDRALWAGGHLGQLHVRADRVRLIVTIEVGDEATRADRARAIAERAIARLRDEETHAKAPAPAPARTVP